jgi:hypothetical protein
VAEGAKENRKGREMDGVEAVDLSKLIQTNVGFREEESLTSKIRRERSISFKPLHGHCQLGCRLEREGEEICRGDAAKGRHVRGEHDGCDTIHRRRRRRGGGEVGGRRRIRRIKRITRR